MGMPGSETALEELMSRILGDHLISGNVTKIADDLYCGADDLDLLLETWRSVLAALDMCDLKLSPSKTVICPNSTGYLRLELVRRKAIRYQTSNRNFIVCRPSY